MELKKIIFFVVFNVCFLPHLSAQFYISGGYNHTTIKDDNLYQNKQGRNLFHLGFDTYIPINSKKTLLQTGQFYYFPRGFSYEFDNTRYLVDFKQITIFGGIAYRPTKFFTLESGFGLGMLYRADISNDTERYKVTENYRRVDLSVYASLNILHTGLVVPYFRYIHGLTNNLSYDRFDDFGNVIGKIKDIKNRVFQIGLKIKILEIF